VQGIKSGNNFGAEPRSAIKHSLRRTLVLNLFIQQVPQEIGDKRIGSLLEKGVAKMFLFKFS
jgi:hypothetical protein